MVDARKGITTQTKRHASIGSLIGIKKAIIAVNKIDLVDYSESIFNSIRIDFENLKGNLNFDEIVYIPISALEGDNIVDKSVKTPWFEGDTLLKTLEYIDIPSNENLASRFQVQWVIRPKDEENHDYRGYAGQVLSGSYQQGDQVKILPSGIETTISRIEKHQQNITKAIAGENVVLHLSENIDISRGDSIVKIDELPTTSNDLKSWVSWLDNTELQIGKTYILQHRFRKVRVKIQSIDKKWDSNQWRFSEAKEIKLNDIGQISLRSNQPLFFDAFEENSKTGNAILIDETTHNTVGALLFLAH